MSAFVKTTDIAYEFKIERNALPKEIANLWNLYVKGPGDDKFVKIVDADMLSTCIAKVGFIFDQDGL